MEAPEDMFEYKIVDGGAVITSYKSDENVRKIIVPDTLGGYPVTQIGESAFGGVLEIDEVYLPDTIKSIGEFAFELCENLDYIKLPARLEYIGANAFRDCYSLDSINLPAGLTYIGRSAFRYCEGLSRVTFNRPEVSLFSVEEKIICEEAFYGCYNLTSVTLPSGVTTISGNVFGGCPNLVSVVLPEGITTIGENAFAGCENLSTIDLPETLTSIGSSAFEGCVGLDTITIPAGVTYIAPDAFMDCEESITIVGEPGSPAEEFAVANGITFKAEEESSVSGDLEYVVDGENVTITGYVGVGGEVVIPETIEAKPVTAIADRAFMNCYDLTAVTIPDSVTTIGKMAFMGCDSLKKVVLPSGINEISDKLFFGCAKLSDVTIPEGVAVIGDYAFNGTGIVNFKVPNSVNSIGDYAFVSCLKLETITILSNVTNFGEDVFGHENENIIIYGELNSAAMTFAAVCDENFLAYSINDGKVCVDKFDFGMGMNTIEIPASIDGYPVTTVAAEAFKDNEWGLCEVILPDGLTTIGANAFVNCDELSAVHIPASVTSIGAGAFTDCSQVVIYSEVGSYAQTYAVENNIPFGTTGESFRYAVSGGNATIKRYLGNATDVVVPDVIDGYPVTAISYDAFRNCSGVISIVLPDAITEISESLLDDCINLQYIYIGKNVANLEGYYFSECLNLVEIEISPENAKYKTVDGVLYTADGASLLRCPPQKYGSVVVPASVTSIGDSAFYNCVRLTSVTLPEGLKNIGYDAFSGASALTSIVIPEGETAIPGNAFSRCTSLKTVVLPESITSIGYSAFFNCTSLETINLPSGINEIDYSAFQGCSSLTSIVIPEGVSTISDELFRDCTSLVDVTLPVGIRNIYMAAFMGCSALKTIELPDTVTYISESIFEGCTSLEEITLHGGLTMISYGMFKNCKSLKSVTIPGSVQYIWERAFEGCTALESIVIPEGVDNIDKYVFADCTALKSVSLPASLTHIAFNAFENVEGLEVSATEGTYAYTWAVEMGYIEGVEPSKAILESAHPYPNNAEDGVDYFADEGTYALKVTFSPFTSFEDDCDFLTVEAIDGSVSYTGAELAGAELYLRGYWFSLYLESDVSVQDYGFKVTSIEELTEDEYNAAVFNTSVREDGTLDITGVAKKDMVSVEIPAAIGGKTVTGIAASAFANMNYLETVKIPEGVSEIAGYAFAYCENLYSVTLPESITAIDTNAFYSSNYVRIFAPEGSYAKDWGVANGFIYEVLMESEHPYADDMDETWSYTHDEEAYALAITFSKATCFEWDCDHIRIKTADGYTQYTGNDLSGKTVKVLGNSFELQMLTDGSVREYGFEVIAIEAITQEEYEAN